MFLFGGVRVVVIGTTFVWENNQDEEKAKDEKENERITKANEYKR